MASGQTLSDGKSSFPREEGTNFDHGDDYLLLYKGEERMGRGGVMSLDEEQDKWCCHESMTIQ